MCPLQAEIDCVSDDMRGIVADAAATVDEAVSIAVLVGVCVAIYAILSVLRGTWKTA